MNPFALHRTAAGEDRSNSPAGLNLETIRELLYREGRWIWWLGLAGILAGLGYGLLRQPKYRISTTLLIGNNNTTAEKLQYAFSRSETEYQQPVLNDQVVMLKSFRLNRTTLNDISRGIRWYRKTTLGKDEIYPDEPFAVTAEVDSGSIRKLDITVEVIDQNSFRFLASGTTADNADLRIDSTGRFGEPLTTPFFQINLSAKKGKAVNPGSVYLIEFTDRTAATRDYLDRLTATTTPTRESGSRITLELETRDLNQDTRYLNRLVENFIRTETADASLAADNAIRLIDQQLTDVRESLAASGNLVSDFRSRTQAISPENEAANAFNIKGQLENRRTEIQVELDLLRQLRIILTDNNSAGEPALPASPNLSDNVLVGRITRLNELYNRRKVLSFSAEDRSPVMQSLNQEIAFLRQGLQESISGAATQAIRELDAVNQRLQQLNGRLASLPRTENTLNGIRRGYDINNELYDFLLGKRAEAEIAKAASRSAIRIVDPAAVETAALISPILPINLSLGLLAGTFAGILLITIRGVLSDVILDESEITSTLRTQPVGSISQHPRNEETVVINSPASAAAEAFRGMRININHVLGTTSNKVLAVHSFQPETGKSFVSLNLALLNARLGRKTLLIDADMRKPRLHAALAMPLGYGLNNFANNSTRTAELIRPTTYAHLDFMSAGTSSQITDRLPDSEKLNKLISELRKCYECIIIDNSPYNILQDAQTIGSCADGNLFLMRIGTSTRKELDDLITVTDTGFLKNIMVAVNGRRMNRKAGYGYYTD